MKSLNILKELRSFLLLWSTQTISELGTAMTNYALVIWVYQQKGTASSLTMLTLCSFLPTILFRFIGGTLADRWDKRRVMIVSDLIAACGTLTILVLYILSALHIWHLYLIHALLSCMNAVQVPASFAATSLLVPMQHYTRINGLQSFSGAAVSILAPALGGVLMALGGMKTVLLIDLVSFTLSFVVLLFLIHIPEIPNRNKETCKNTFGSDCTDGLHFLRSHRAILHITLFMAAVNFLAKLGNDGMLAPFVLGRTGNNEQALGVVQSAVSAGLLAGSLLLTFLKPAKNKSRLAYGACSLIFAFGLVQSIGRSVVIWSITAFFTYLSATVMNANLTTLLREQVPLHMHGRVFSAKDTLQNYTIPLGLFLGGLLADHVFEPMMAATTPLQLLFSPIFGTGNGTGIAVQFFCVSVLGILLSLSQLKKKRTI